MMKTFFKRVFGIILVAVMCLTLASCGSVFLKTANIKTPLVVAYDPFSGNFNPFFADAAHDHDVIDMTQLGLMTTDRSGGIVYNAIKGETKTYNGIDYIYKGPADISVTINDDGTTTYRAKIRDDIKFSDGVKMTADDIIFTYYVLCDPSYTGSSTLSSYNIVGLQNYQTQTTDEIFEKYRIKAMAIYSAGPDHTWTQTDTWTQAEQDGFWALLKQVWIEDIQSFVNYFVVQSVGENGEAALGKTPEEIVASQGLSTAFTMIGMQLGILGENGVFTTISGKTFDIKNGVYPTIETLYDEIYAMFGGSAPVWSGAVGSDIDIPHIAVTKFIGEYGSRDEGMGQQGVPNITGIKKIDEYTVEVTTVGYEAPAVYSILGISVAPLHYYGDTARYDYAANRFGFTFGDLSGVRAKTSSPLGAGAYEFVKYEDKVVYFEANENYYKGCPKLEFIQFKEVSEADKISSLNSGVVDIANPNGNITNLKAIRDINGGTLEGPVVSVNFVDFLGYGYIGLNADAVNVNGDPDSDASVNLRKGIATILAVYRDVSANSFFGDAAAVINYPISNTSWAAPQKSDPDYEVAFSKDVAGKDIYTSDMDSEAKYNAALQAAVGFFKAAGFIFDEAAGMFTAAPQGGKFVYDALISAYGSGNHPSFQLLSNTAAALKTIGFTLNIIDPPDPTEVLNRMNAGTQEIWVSAWQASSEPDMFQIYHSSNILGNGGTDSNYYHIADAGLDQLILDARKSSDQAYRRIIYKECFEIILDQAVEVPSYQRQNIMIFSVERIKIETITPDLTTHWDWMHDIELLEVYEAE